MQSYPGSTREKGARSLQAVENALRSRRPAAYRGPPPGARNAALRAALTLMIAASAWNLSAQTNLHRHRFDPVLSATKVFHDTQKRYRSNPGSSEAAWQFARACFDLAEFASDSTERAELAEQGIAACRELIAREPNSALGHYYLGMNLGQLARTKGIGALKIVNEMEREFTIAARLDETMDHAGPDRNLGYLYRDAPSIGSVGSRTHARQHLERAVRLAPDFPENRLALVEAFLKWKDRNGVQRELKALEALWPEARKTYSGVEWETSWTDWNERLKNIKKKIEDIPKPLESPRQKD